jgi:hypothetical protein
MEEQTGEYGAWMNGYPKHVASITLEEPLEWNNSTLIEGDVAEGVSTSSSSKTVRTSLSSAAAPW